MTANRLLLGFLIGCHALLCTGLLMHSDTAAAQTLYRCGQTYQDKPCESGGYIVVTDDAPASAPTAEKNKPTKNTKSPSTTPVAPTTATPIDDDCQRHGDSAKKLRWGKETGLTESVQTQRDPANAAFIRYVYGKLGSALDVKKLVEKDCMSTKAQQAAEQAKLAVRTGQNGFIPPVSVALPPPATPQAVVASAPIASPIEEAPKRSAIINNAASSTPKVDEAFCKSLSERESSLKKNQQVANTPLKELETIAKQLLGIQELRVANQCK